MENGDLINATKIVSSIGAYNTFKKLITDSKVIKNTKIFLIMFINIRLVILIYL